ncbi:MAG TPA: DUF6311 domain-containing protein [Kofleriaceae bacterium]|nr:DUF6311 domain-containing protein [Kofleriaceae bacterium]
MQTPRALHVYAVAAALGLATYLVVYGPGHLLGTSAYWTMPINDERMNLVGYRYFLLEPWHWPLFDSDRIAVPATRSLAFLDVIPLWALFNKLVATLVPPWRVFSASAYLGMWHGLAYVLQPCFGIACLRALGHRTWREALVGALFFLAVPAWIFRYGHGALSAHWIELWAFYLYLRTPPRERLPRRLGYALIAQLAVGSLVTPYHPVMSLPISAAALVRTRDRRSIVTWLPVCIATVVLATWIAGYFDRESHGHQWGFEAESANLLTWLVPVRSGFFGDARWLANTLATDQQWEGYAYFGLGYLGLLAAFAPHAAMLPSVVRRHGLLFGVAIVFGLVALSNHVYLGSHEIATYSIPSFLHRFPDQFRSPGRFVWIPMYLAMLFVLHWAFTRFATRFWIVVLALAVQLFDVRGDWALQRAQASGPTATSLDLATWRTLIETHQRVAIYPVFHCVVDPDRPGLDLVSTEIQLLASETALPINDTYTVHPPHDCRHREIAWPDIALEPGTLYVIFPRADAIADRFVAHGATCARFAQGRACSTDAAAIRAAFPAH